MHELETLWTSIPPFVGWGVTLFSLVLLLLVPYFVKKLPTDHFIKPQNGTLHPLRFILANVVAGFLIVVGVLLLFLPGQGLLTILAGLSVGHYPGKDWVIQKAIRRPGVRRVLNQFRRKMGAPPFRWEPAHDHRKPTPR
jgi:hypothetical protein